jgi:hypothetical protein
VSAATLPTAAGALWPEPAEVHATRRPSRVGSAGDLAYLVVPSLDRPRYFVPADVPAAERMLTTHGGGRADRWARAGWRRAHRAGMAARLPLTRLVVRPDPAGIEAYLAEVLGEPIRIGVLLGPPRANLKPVVQIFAADGTTLAFAKLGTSPLTADLLATEAGALRLLAAEPPTTFTAPELVHHGTWKDVPVLVQRALPLAQADRASASPPLDVMVEIALLQGVAVRPLAGSDYGQRVSRPRSERWNDIDLTPFTRLADLLSETGEVPFGCWHGDFGPWNLGVDGTRVEIWDWERFACDVPIGIDAAHYRAQRGVAAQLDPVDAWPSICADVSEVLRAAGQATSAAEPVAGCYLLEIVGRYLADVGDEPTVAMRRRMTWLAAVATVAADHRSPIRTGGHDR